MFVNKEIKTFSTNKKFFKGAAKSLLISGALVFSSSVMAGSMEKAHKLHRVIASVKGDTATINQMAAQIEGGDIKAAANLAMQNRYFYDITLKNMFGEMTNNDANVDVPLNDASATMIGVVKDNKSFIDAIIGDIIYIGRKGLADTDYSKKTQDAKDHYKDIEDSGEALSTALVPSKQSTFTGISLDNTAGIMTSQAWGEAFFMAGTNRRVWMGAMRALACNELEEMMDTSLPGTRIRRDVDRAPGGVPGVFLNKCIGCHSLMDSLGGAVAYFDYDADDGITHTPGKVVQKVNRLGDTFPSGYVTTDDSWNYLGNKSATGILPKKLGWRGPASGKGLRSFATALSQTRIFSECMSKRVFTKICSKKPGVNDKGLISKLADSFEKDGNYNMKGLVAETSQYCLDED